MNAIVNRTSTGYNLMGCTLYTTYSPCVECAKLIVQSEIKEVVYGRVYETDAEITKQLMERAKVKYRYIHNHRIETTVYILSSCY